MLVQSSTGGRSTSRSADILLVSDLGICHQRDGICWNLSSTTQRTTRTRLQPSKHRPRKQDRALLFRKIDASFCVPINTATHKLPTDVSIFAGPDQTRNGREKDGLVTEALVTMSSYLIPTIGDAGKSPRSSTCVF